MRFISSSAAVLAVVFVAACAAAPPIAATSTATSTPSATSTSTPSAVVRAAVDASDRLASDRALDAGRHPVEILTFLGAAPGQRIAEIGSYTGYMADLLGRIVAPSGQVYAQDPPKLVELTHDAWAARKDSPAMKTIVRVARPFDDPLPPDVTGLDAVVVGLFYHDMVWLNVDRAKLNAAAFHALKSGGVYFVYDHSARAGAGVDDAKTIHRIEEKVVRQEIEAAGFRLAATSDLLRHPEDKRDWDASDDGPKDRRGTSDRFILKYVKP
jgi:predicted methyltransferase